MVIPRGCLFKDGVSFNSKTVILDKVFVYNIWNEQYLSRCHFAYLFTLYQLPVPVFQ